MTPLFSIWYPVIILNECCNERFSTKLYLKIILYWFFYHIFTPQKYPQTSLIWQILPNAPYTTIKKQVLVPMGTNYFVLQNTHPPNEYYNWGVPKNYGLETPPCISVVPCDTYLDASCQVNYVVKLYWTLHEFWKTFTTFSYTDICLSQIHLHTYA